MEIKKIEKSDLVLFPHLQEQGVFVTSNEENVLPCPKAAKSNLRGPIFAASRPRYSCVPSVASETSSSDGSLQGCD